MNIFLKTLILSVILLCIPVASYASEISFDSKGNQFTLGEEFIISMQVDTQGQSINAIEGSINFPIDLVDIKEVRDGNSVVNFWLEKPDISKPGVIRFAGITPGGFSGARNALFSIVLRATGEGNGIIYGTDLQSLLSDGMGTSTPIKNESLPIVVSSKGTLDGFKPKFIFPDTEMPEDFTPIITSDPGIFNGKYFLVFSTQDKSSGVNYYKVREGRFGFFVEAKSPYLLRNQSLSQKIYVKAVDKNGNEKVETLEPQNKQTLYQNYVIFAIILTVIIFILFIKKIWLKYIK
ncbi:hypothetical protein HY311_01495 [Candidatus Nomurabacteria bacterium]|nr:hypothetical protein [Candidatus Nomurabacteria bacterium]